MKTTNRARTVLWTATGVQFVSGILYIWSIVSKALINQYGWTSTEASLPYTAATIVMALAMIFGGLFQDKKGPRLAATIGTSMLGIGLILSSFAYTPVVMIITFSLIVGIGMGINNAASTPAALKWYSPSKKGMITGIVVAGIGIASVFYSPLINYLVGDFGVSKSFMILGIGALVVSVPMAQFIVNPPKGYIAEEAPKVQEKKNTPVQGKDVTWKAMIKTADFYKLWVMLAFSAAAGLMIIGHIANIAKIQASWEGGFLLVALLAIFNALGRFAGGTLSDKIGRINMMRLVFLVQAVNMLLFSLFTSPITLAVGVILAGFCYGATFAVFPATTADFYGVKNMGANYGVMFTAWGLGGIIGPISAGRIFDLTGSYNTAYIVALVLLLVATVITFTFRKKKSAKQGEV